MEDSLKFLEVFQAMNAHASSPRVGDNDGVSAIMRYREFVESSALLGMTRSLNGSMRISTFDDLGARFSLGHRDANLNRNNKGNEKKLASTSLYKSLNNRRHVGWKDGSSEYDVHCEKEIFRKMRIVKKVTSHTRSIYSIKISCDGKHLLTGSDDYLIKSFSLEKLELERTFRGHKNCIVDISTKELVNKTRTILVSSGMDCNVFVWDLHTAELISRIRWHSKPCGPLGFVRELLCTTGDDGTACLWDVDRIVQADLNGGASSDRGPAAQRLEGAHVPIVLPHVVGGRPLNVNTLSIHPSGAFIATGDGDGYGRIWSVTETEHVHCKTSKNAEYVLNATGVFIQGASRLCTSAKAHTAPCTQIAWSNAGDRLFTASVNETKVRIWGWGENRKFSDLEPFASFFVQPTIVSLDVLARREIDEFNVMSSDVFSSVKNIFSNGKSDDFFVQSILEKLKTAQSNDPIVSKGESLCTLDAVVWTCDDRRIVTAHSIQPRKPNDLTSDPLTADIRHNVDGDTFVDQLIKIWDSSSGVLLCQGRKHRRPSYCLLPHPTFANLLVSVGHDAEVVFWDIDSCEILNSITVPCVIGPSPVVDGLFLVQNEGSKGSEMILTDAAGRLLIFSTTYSTTSISQQEEPMFSSPLFQDTLSEQFFHNDFSDLSHAVFNDPPLICDANFERYPTDIFTDENFRRMLVTNFDQTLFTRECNAMYRVKDSLDKLDRYVELASLLDDMRPKSDFYSLTVFFKLLRGLSLEEENGINSILITPAIAEETTFEFPGENSHQPRSIRMGVSTSRRIPEVTRLANTQEAQPGAASILHFAANSRINPLQVSSSSNARRVRQAAQQATERMRVAMQAESSLLNGTPVANVASTSSAIVNNSMYSRMTDDDDSSVRRSTRLIEQQHTQQQFNAPILEEMSLSYSTRRVISSRTNESGISNYRPYYSRHWLCQTHIKHVFDSYVPQMDDKIVFFSQGWITYSSCQEFQDDPDISSSHVPNYILEQSHSKARVVSMEYVFPAENAHRRSIGVKLELEVSEVCNSSHSPLDYTLLSEPIKFVIVLAEHTHPEFIVLEAAFEWSLHADLAVGDEVVAYFKEPSPANADEFVLIPYQGTLQARESGNLALWKEWTIRWINHHTNDLEEGSKFSRWEFERIDQQGLEEAVKNQVCVKENICNGLERAIEDLKLHPSAKYFIDPVDSEKITGYDTIIPVKMDLGMIFERLESGYYRSLNSIQFDCELIYRNCAIFNAEGARIVQQALDTYRRMEKELISIDHAHKFIPGKLPLRSLNTILPIRIMPPLISASTSKGLINEFEDTSPPGSTRRSMRQRKKLNYNTSGGVNALDFDEEYLTDIDDEPFHFSKSKKLTKRQVDLLKAKKGESTSQGGIGQGFFHEEDGRGRWDDALTTKDHLATRTVLNPKNSLCKETQSEDEEKNETQLIGPNGRPLRRAVMNRKKLEDLDASTSFSDDEEEYLQKRSSFKHRTKSKSVTGHLNEGHNRLSRSPRVKIEDNMESTNNAIHSHRSLRLRTKVTNYADDNFGDDDGGFENPRAKRSRIIESHNGGQPFLSEPSTYSSGRPRRTGVATSYKEFV